MGFLMLSLQTVGNAGVEERSNFVAGASDQAAFNRKALRAVTQEQADEDGTELSEKSRERMSCIIDYGLARRLQNVGKNENRHDSGVLSEMCKGCLDTIQAAHCERPRCNSVRPGDYADRVERVGENADS